MGIRIVHHRSAESDSSLEGLFAGDEAENPECDKDDTSEYEIRIIK